MGLNKKINIYFPFFSITIIAWSLSLYFYSGHTLLDSLSWIKIIYLLTIASIFGLLRLIIAVSQKHWHEYKAFLSIFLISSALISLFIFVNNKILELVPSPPIITFLLIFFMYIAWIALILLEKTFKTSDAERSQAMPILSGFGLFITAIMVSNVFMPLLLSSTNYLWLNPALTFSLIGFIAIVISPYHFSPKIKTRGIKFLVWITGIILLLMPFLAHGLTLKIFIIVTFLLFCFLGNLFVKVESKQKEDVEKIAEEWEQLNISKDQFILSFQHHLRTPLVPIKGYLEMILKGTYGREDNPLIREKLIEIHERVKILSSLIEGLLDVQQARVGKEILSLENYQVNDLIESVVEELIIEAEKKRLYLSYNKIPLPLMNIDREKIRTVIWNLVDNAIKYTNTGGVTIVSEIKENKLRIGVSDTGIGMKEEEITRFLKGNLFERGEEAKKLYGPGRGIGLSLCIEYLKIHGGRIWAESKGQSEGTTFWIEVPIK